MTEEKRRSRHEYAKIACLGKIKHKSMLAAEYTLDRMTGKDSHLLEIYKCRFCHTYHIGHSKKNSLKTNHHDRN